MTKSPYHAGRSPEPLLARQVRASHPAAPLILKGDQYDEDRSSTGNH